MPTDKGNLLIVDDIFLIRELLSAFFKESGYSVRSAQDGYSALVEIRSEVPDILLSDLNMPGMSGFELLSVVRSKFPKIQAIAMSSGLPKGGEPRVVADAFYRKGTNLGRLLQIVEAMRQREWPLPRRRLVPKQHDVPGNVYVATDQLSGVSQDKIGLLLQFNPQRNHAAGRSSMPKESYAIASGGSADAS